MKLFVKAGSSVSKRIQFIPANLPSLMVGLLYWDLGTLDSLKSSEAHVFTGGCCLTLRGMVMGEGVMNVSPVQLSVAQSLGEAPEWQVILTAS